MCFGSPRWFPALSAYSPQQTDLLSLPSVHTGPASPSPCSNLNLSPPSNLFFFSPTAPSKMIFFFYPSQKIHTPMLSHYSLQQHAKFAVIFPLGLCPEKDKVVCAHSYLLQAPWNWKRHSASARKDLSEFWAQRPPSREANISLGAAPDSNILIVWLAKEK